MARSRYRMSPKRRAALRKAQLASARKRKGRGISRKKKAGIGVGVGVLAAGVAYHKITKSEFSLKVGKNDNSLRARPSKANSLNVTAHNWGATKADVRARRRSSKPADRMSGHRDVQVRASVANRFIQVTWRGKGGLRPKPTPGRPPQMQHFTVKQSRERTVPKGFKHGVLIYHGNGTRVI